jgi:hypothetical protein
MANLKFVKVNDPLTGEEVEELHPIEICAECSREIDNAIEGFYGHGGIPKLILCQDCYPEKVGSGQWEATRVNVQGEWFPE